MNTRLLTAMLGAALIVTPLSFAQDQKPSPAAPAKTTQAKGAGMSKDMQDAIDFERAKDRADARQARIEAGQSASADRAMESKTTSHKVKAPKKTEEKRDQ